MFGESNIIAEKKRHTKRVKNLIIICSMIAVVLSVSTYAWFIGMRTVNVSSFEITIASIDSLELSLNGKQWSNEVTISKATYNNTNVVYENNTNSWGGKGLIPMSSVGEMDKTASRMILFEKASLTSTPGGYRLMASRVDNHSDGKTEQDGYVVFDLFIKNHTGDEYYPDENLADEEAIYLTTDSEVKVALTGGSAGASSDSDDVVGVENTGIENSVRVGFAQIGRVSIKDIKDENDAAILARISCDDETQDSKKLITGLCRRATIWEPNDTQHVQNAINWYEKSCLKRNSDGSDVRDPNSYSNEDCNPVVNGQAYPTYAVKKTISSGDNVNGYDGPAYNSYTKTIENELLEAYEYFTDTDKFQKGTARPLFMTLAPNSITKVRVYVWIEGQDIDNYDFAAIGRKISVKFGFTKQRFTEGDIDYSGPDVNQGEGPGGADKTMPVIKLNPANAETGEINHTVYVDKTDGAKYTDPGIESVNDNVDGTIAVENVKIEGSVNLALPGQYPLIYKVWDEAGNLGTAIRFVNVVEAED